MSIWSGVLPEVLLVAWLVVFFRNLPDLLRIPHLTSQESSLFHTDCRHAREASAPNEHERRMPKVSVVIAAKNEAARIGRTLDSLTSQAYDGDIEIVVVNDRSEDATGHVIDARANQDSRIRPVHITYLPSGWLGKNHALYQGAKVANGEYILFADADVYFYPDAIHRAMAYAVEHQIDHLTIAPKMIARTTSLQLLTAFFTFNYLLFKRPHSAYRKRTRAHAGIGAFNLVRRNVYDAIGTHRAIMLRPDDDIYLGKLIKKHGYRQQFGIAESFVEIEWYDTTKDMLHGLEKAPLAAFRFSPTALILSMIPLLILYGGPILGLVVGPGPYRWLYGIACVLMLSLYTVHVAYLKFPKYQIALLPIAMLLFIYGFVRAGVLAHRRGGLIWRDTFYAFDELKINASPHTR
ncbi:glycosyltransferase [Alicyclobacillus suci]|uniref:glycosyltransferase n=1 Tax=Alicyclobacillus suci TaxID=2816080 RepID=UPI0011BEDB16|nr:glycosyltransferase family 2 protein [Alicyclobacillus suci]